MPRPLRLPRSEGYLVTHEQDVPPTSRQGFGPGFILTTTGRTTMWATRGTDMSAVWYASTVLGSGGRASPPSARILFASWRAARLRSVVHANCIASATAAGP